MRIDRRVLFIVFAFVVATALRAQQYASTFFPRPWAFAAVSPTLRDLNGNGLPDLIFMSTTNGNALDLLVVLFDPLTAPPALVPPAPLVIGSQLPVPGVLQWFDVEDLDGDGIPDLVFGADPNVGVTSSVYWLRGLGGGVFAGSPTLIVSTNVAGRPVFGDFNADGLTDIAMYDQDPVYYSNRLGVYLSGPATPWARAYTGPVAYSVGALVSGDFNGDGAADIAHGYVNGATVQDEMLLGLPPGAVGQPSSFAPAIPLTTNFLHSAPVGPKVYDSDADGLDDLLRGTQIYRGSATGGFAAPVTVAGFLGGAVPMTPDTNGDGAVDFVIMAAAHTPTRFRILECRGPFGTAVVPFEIATIPAVTPNLIPPIVPWGVLVPGDLDADGDTDFMIFESASYLSGIHVVENRAHYGAGAVGAAGMPQITITTPALGAAVFSVGLANAAPSSLAALLLSVNATIQSTGGLQVNIAPSALILVNGQLIAGLTSPTGTGLWSTPVPNQPALAGLTLYAQWAVLDPLGAFAYGGVNLALSEGRAVTFY